MIESAKQALKKLTQKALTKTFYYSIVKSIAKAFGPKMTKEVFAKGVSKSGFGWDYICYLNANGN